MNIFEQTPPSRRRYGLAAFIGLIAGIVSAFVKWGAEVAASAREALPIYSPAHADRSN
jgi:putative membrane protein